MSRLELLVPMLSLKISYYEGCLPSFITIVASHLRLVRALSSRMTLFTTVSTWPFENPGIWTIRLAVSTP